MTLTAGFEKVWDQFSKALVKEVQQSIGPCKIDAVTGLQPSEVLNRLWKYQKGTLDVMQITFSERGDAFKYVLYVEVDWVQAYLIFELELHHESERYAIMGFDDHSPLGQTDPAKVRSIISQAMRYKEAVEEDY